MFDFLKNLKTRLSLNVRPLSINEANLKKLLKYYGFNFKKIKYYHVVHRRKSGSPDLAQDDELLKISEFTFTNTDSVYTLKITGNLNEFIDYYADRKNNLFMDIIKFQKNLDITQAARAFYA